MPTNIDFSVTERKMIPADTYEAQLLKVDRRKTLKGDPKHTFRLGIESENTTLFRDFVLTPSALFYLKEALIALGADPDDFNTEPGESVDVDAIEESLIGNYCMVDVIEDSYEDQATGETKLLNRVTKVKPFVK